MTIDELRSRRDVWPIILEALPEALGLIHYAVDETIEHPDLITHLERKFRKGEAEHGGAWLRNVDDPSWLITEAAEEILDFILYQCMFILLTEAKRGE